MQWISQNKAYPVYERKNWLVYRNRCCSYSNVLLYLWFPGRLIISQNKVWSVHEWTLRIAWGDRSSSYTKHTFRFVISWNAINFTIPWCTQQCTYCTSVKVWIVYASRFCKSIRNLLLLIFKRTFTHLSSLHQVHNTKYLMHQGKVWIGYLCHYCNGQKSHWCSFSNRTFILITLRNIIKSTKQSI